MNRFVNLVFVGVLAAVVAALLTPETREPFEALTRAHPYGMGILKIALLGTMGELLGRKIRTGAWKFSGIRLWQRVLVWGFLGAVFAVVFPLFSFGVEGLLDKGLIPGRGEPLVTAFWKSFFMNGLFAFPMMVFHRITDTLIDRGQLFSRWPLVDVFVGIDWRTMFNVVGTSCIWFWIPAHTLTFSLPAEYRVMSAALLSMALGFILGVASARAARRV